MKPQVSYFTAVLLAGNLPVAAKLIIYPYALFTSFKWKAMA